MSTKDNSTIPYTEGDRVEYEGQQYIVSFAQESYITLRHDNGALPIVFPPDWGHIHPITK